MRPGFFIAAAICLLGCDGTATWICNQRDKKCPDNQLCVSPSDLPEGNIEQVTVPACFQICTVHDGTASGCPEDRACLGDKGSGGLCTFFDKACREKICPAEFYCDDTDTCKKDSSGPSRWGQAQWGTAVWN